MTNQTIIDSGSEDSWIENYYEALEFYYWEPQHLGRKKAVDSKLNSLAKVRDHLPKMEVSLNHQIRQFFSLAPRSFRNKLFRQALKRDVPGDFLITGRDLYTRFELGKVTQPDFVFIEKDNLQSVSMEMKILAKSSVSQVLKYAFLASAVERKVSESQNMKHSLIMLGPGDFASFWKEGFATPQELSLGIETSLDSFLSKLSKEHKELHPRLAEIAISMAVGSIRYEEFAKLLELEVDPSDASNGAQVYRNLVSGMAREFDKRGLTGRKAESGLD